MEEQQPGHGHGDSTTPSETNDRGLTDFLGKKDNKSSQQDVAMIDLDCQDTDLKEKRTHTLLEELQRTHTNSSSSSDEEVEDGREGKKRKKKGLMKDVIVKEKISREEQQGELDNGNGKQENQEATNSEEKKGFLEIIIDKLPGHGHHKKTEGGTPTTIPANQEDSSGGETKEKKGIFDKIKEKLPGHHKNEDEPKLKEN